MNKEDIIVNIQIKRKPESRAEANTKEEEAKRRFPMKKARCKFSVFLFTLRVERKKGSVWITIKRPHQPNGSACSSNLVHAPQDTPMQELEQFLDLLYGMFSYAYTTTELRQMMISDPFDRSASPRLGQIGGVYRLAGNACLLNKRKSRAVSCSKRETEQPHSL